MIAAHTNNLTALRTLSIGGATFDLFLMMGDIDASSGCIHLPVGDKVQVQRIIEACGGGASNTAVALSRLGCSASFCGVVGSDQWGEKLLKNLLSEKVDTTPATIVEHETSSFSIILSLPGGERTILYAPGVNEHLHDTTFDRDAIRGIDGVYLNHLCETSCMISDDIVEALANDPDITLAWNPGGCQIDAGMHAKDAKALLQLTDLLLLNKEEAFRFSGSSSVEDALKKLTTAGAGNVCITDGKNGVLGSDGTHVYRCPILKNVNVIDTTGAGDAFGAAAFSALLHGDSLQNAMICGTLNAASVVGSIGAQAGLLTDIHIKERMREHPLAVEIVS